jgi:LPS O-antigen subunit length determinant protein (WzzB/FepE family)
LTIEWTDPKVAADWANLLVKRLNERMRQRALQEAEVNVSYLKRELAATNVVALQHSIGNLLEGELQKAMLARVNDEFAFRVIDRAEAPKWRSRPKRAQIMAIAVLAGFVLGCVVVLVRKAVSEVEGAVG